MSGCMCLGCETVLVGCFCGRCRGVSLEIRESSSPCVPRGMCGHFQQLFYQRTERVAAFHCERRLHRSQLYW